MATRAHTRSMRVTELPEAPLRPPRVVQVIMCHRGALEKLVARGAARNLLSAANLWLSTHELEPSVETPPSAGAGAPAALSGL